MCKSKAEGGMRCAGHTRPALVKAYDRYREDPTQRNLEKLKEARDAYLETPEGWKKSIPAGEVEVKNPDGSVRRIPLHELYQDDAEMNPQVRDNLAQMFKERREETVRAWKERREAIAEELRSDDLRNPDDFYAKARPYWEEEGADEAEKFGYAQEPVEGEELDSEGYGVISGINENGFRRDGKHYLTNEKYDEYGVDEHGWTKSGINVATGERYDLEGRNRRGFDPRTRLHRNGTKYDDEGYDIEGYDRKGYGKDGWNKKKTRHRDTAHLPSPACNYDLDGYGPDMRDKDGFHKIEGTDKRGFLRDGRFKGREHLPRPLCLTDARGFTAKKLNIITGTEYDPEGYDWQGYDKYNINRRGQLNPAIAPNATTALIHTHKGFKNPLVQAGYTERNGWYTDNARAVNRRKRFIAVVKTGYRYRNKPMRMIWEVGTVIVRHRQEDKRIKLYIAAVKGSENRTIAFTNANELKRFLKTIGAEGVPFGAVF